MKILKLYENLLIEAEIESCVKKFGHELFGHELGGTETNTSIENSYVRNISDFTDNKYGADISPSFIKAIKSLSGCMKQYPEVLIPEKTNVYRGLTIPAKYFIEKGQPISLTNPFPYKYKAKNQIQSWTSDVDAASTFGNHDTLNEVSRGVNFSDYQTPQARQELLHDMVDEELRMAFVLQYTTNQNEFIFKSKYFKMLSMAHHEDELIRIDNKPITTIAKFNDHSDVFLTTKGLTLLKFINQAIVEAKGLTR